MDVSAQFSGVSSEVPAVTSICLSWAPFGHNRLLVDLEWITVSIVKSCISSGAVGNTSPDLFVSHLGFGTTIDCSRTVDRNFSSIRWDINWDFESHFEGSWDVEFNHGISSNKVTNTGSTICGSKGSAVVNN